MKTSENQSYLLGQLVGTSHLMEELLQEDREMKTFTETNLGAFCNDPIKMFSVFYKKVIVMSMKLEEMGKKTILGELSQISKDLENIDFETMDFIKFDFMRGFQQQLAWGRLVKR